MITVGVGRDAGVVILSGAARVVSPDEILALEADVVSPNALGAILTGTATDEDLERTRARSVRLLSKPCDLSELKTAVRDAITPTRDAGSSGNFVRTQRRRSRGSRKPQSASAGNGSSTKDYFQCPDERRQVMSGFSIRNPYFIVVVCLIVAVVGVTSLVRMPVDS